MADVRCSRCRALISRDEYAAHIPCGGPPVAAPVTPPPEPGPAVVQQVGQPGLPGMPILPSMPQATGEVAKHVLPYIHGIVGAVLRQVHSMGERGATCDEVEIALDGKHQTISARIRDLVQQDYLMDTGRRRHTRSGRTARVYVLK